MKFSTVQQFRMRARKQQRRIASLSRSLRKAYAIRKKTLTRAARRCKKRAITTRTSAVRSLKKVKLACKALKQTTTKKAYQYFRRTHKSLRNVKRGLSVAQQKNIVSIAVLACMLIFLGVHAWTK